jgi:hypothetical protein
MRHLGLVLALSCVGCGTSQWQLRQRERVQRDDEESMGQLLSRARFELQCPSATLEVLERFEKLATLAGVKGCGRAASYRRRLRYSRAVGGRTPENTIWELEAMAPFSDSAPKQTEP